MHFKALNFNSKQNCVTKYYVTGFWKINHFVKHE